MYLGTCRKITAQLFFVKARLWELLLLDHVSIIKIDGRKKSLW